MVIAAEQKVNATPMEVLIPAEMDKLLNLSKKGLKSAIIYLWGYRDAENDWNVHLKKVVNQKMSL